MISASAISAFDNPRAISSSTSRSRAVRSSSGRRAADPVPVLRHPLDHPAGDRGRQERSPPATVWIAVSSSSGLLRLRRNPRRSRAERPEDVVVLLERGQDHDPDLRSGRDQLSRRRDAVEVGHADVHQHHVRVQQPGAVDRVAPVAGLADHLDGGVARQHPAQAGSHQVVVVHDQHSNGRGHSGATGSLHAPGTGPLPRPRRASAEQVRALAHPDDAVSGPVLPARRRADRVGHGQLERRGLEGHEHLGGTLAVARRVGQRLLEDAIGPAIDVRGQGAPRPSIVATTSRPAARCRATSARSRRGPAAARPLPTRRPRAAPRPADRSRRPSRARPPRSSRAPPGRPPRRARSGGARVPRAPG